MKRVRWNRIIGGLILILVFVVLVVGWMVLNRTTASTGLTATLKSAERGDATAQFNLGLIYGKGEGVPRDFKQAFEWYKKAAEQGHLSAQSNLGVLYYNGQGVAQNFTSAYAWLNLAAAQGLIVAVKNRDLAAKELTPAQMREARELSAAIQRRRDHPVARTEH
jgi:TPR repeat protein